jgi:sugar-phosphatase
VDSTPAVARVWASWAGKFGFEPAEVVRRAHGRPSITTVRELLPEGDHQAENREIERLEIGDIEGVIALPGTRELLDALPTDRYAIVTSASRPLALVRIQAAGFPIPPHLVTASDIQRGKPDPEPYLLGAQGLQVAPADCIVIEDAPAGVQSGKAAGARVIALRTTTDESALLEAGADWVIADCSSIALRPVQGNELLTLQLRGAAPKHAANS